MVTTNFLQPLTLAAIANLNADFASANRAARLAVGDAFHLTNFGVNYTRIPPGAISALRHHHSHQDEFVLVLSGYPTLVTNSGECQLEPGMVAGFAAGSGDGHHLLNRTNEDVLCLEVGDRHPADQVTYVDASEAEVKAALAG